MALRAEHEQTACIQHLLALGCDFRLDPILFQILLGAIFHVAQFVVDPEIDVAAQLNVRTAAGHVGRNGHGTDAPCLRHDMRFALVLARVENFVIDAFLPQEFAEHFRLFDRHRADQHRLSDGILLGDRLGDGFELVLRILVEFVVLIDAGDGNIGRYLDHVHLVDVPEFGSFGGCGTGHTRQLGIHAEVVLEGDRSERLVLRLDLHALLGLHRLVQAVRPAATVHHAAGKLVDDDDLVVLDDVVDVLLEHVHGAQGLVEMVHDLRVLHVVEIFRLQQTLFDQQLLDFFSAFFGQLDAALLLVLLVPVFGEGLHHLVDRDVEVGFVLGRPGNDQRRTRLVDEDGIHLVDDRVIERTLHHLAALVLHIVAQVIETQFVIRRIGNVGIIRIAALRFGKVGHDHAHRQAEEAVQAAHPFRVARGEVIVHGHDVNALALDRVQIGRQCRDQRLAFTGAHFRNFAAMEDDTAHHLHVEMPHAQHPDRCLAYGGEGFGKNIVQRLAIGQLATELVGLGGKFLVGKRLQLRFERIDLCDDFTK